MASGQYPALPDEGWGVPESQGKDHADNTILKSL